MKLRTHKTTAKRFRITGGKTPKIQRPTLSMQHIRHNKSRRSLASAKSYVLAALGDAKRVRRLLPYLGK
jgi:large subunit ribosomal protein L35